MLYGPCGDDNPNAPCIAFLRSGHPKVYTKKYLREFRENTVIEEDGYPLYRRRDNGQRVTKQIKGRSVTLYNRHVVPYSPYLSRKYNAHINVEVCGSIRAVKYIHKYVYKGTNRITVGVSG